MKTLVLLLIGVVPGLGSRALAQSDAANRRPNYFGTANPNGADSAAKAGDPTPSPQTGLQSADEKTKAGQERKPAQGDPEMKKAFDLLKAAKEKMQLSAAGSKTDPTAFIEAARDALKKSPGDGRFHGHRAKAMKLLNDALAELKSGDRGGKAAGYVGEAITEIYNSGGLYK